MTVLASRRVHRSAGGFTLLELVIVMGLLTGFLMFLTQLLSGGVALFDEGETGQELADLGNAAAEPLRESMVDMVGPVRDAYESGPPDARLLAQWVLLGFAADAAKAPRVQALRATVRLDERRETALLTELMRGRGEDQAGARAETEERLAAMVAAEPRRGRAEMVLLPWPAGDPDGAFLELHRGYWLPDQRIVLGPRREAGLFEIEPLSSLPPELLTQQMEVVASGLLHVEFAFWSQDTTSWSTAAGGSDQAAQRSPQQVWDSARAGLLAEAEDPTERFVLDLGEQSLTNATDDVFPRAVRITLVVAREEPDAMLAEELAPGQSTVRLISAERLLQIEPDPPLVKIGGEWVRYSNISGSELSGLRRAQRGTPARRHPLGTPVWIGKTIVLEVPLAHGRDCWNG